MAPDGGSPRPARPRPSLPARAPLCVSVAAMLESHREGMAAIMSLHM
jgi:hypothetical protein